MRQEDVRPSRCFLGAELYPGKGNKTLVELPGQLLGDDLRGEVMWESRPSVPKVFFCTKVGQEETG